MSYLTVIRVNDLTCYIYSQRLGRNIALVAYSVKDKCWVAEIIYNPISDKTLMTIAKFVYKKNKETNPEYALAT